MRKWQVKSVGLDMSGDMIPWDVSIIEADFIAIGDDGSLTLGNEDRLVHVFANGFWAEVIDVTDH